MAAEEPIEDEEESVESEGYDVGAEEDGGVPRREGFGCFLVWEVSESVMGCDCILKER